ncbi:MAG: hypothetical protein R3F49_13490 [Planctomycetota bacterium]
MAALSIGALWLPWPFAWIFGAWSLYWLVCGVRWKSRAGKLVALSLFATALMLTIGEVTLLVKPGIFTSGRFEGTYTTGDLWAPQPDLGYAPAPGLKVEARRVVNEETLYVAHYSYDEHRMRVAPPVDVDPPEGAILCFGGSFTLGEGVDDEFAYPYRVGELSGHRYEVRNFGFHGYGAHQSLAALQSGLVDKVLHSAPKLALYLAIPDHGARVSGRKAWDAHGPWYRVADGKVERAGAFHDRPAAAIGSRVWISKQLYKSALFGRLRPEPYQVLDSELRNLEAVLGELKDELVRRYPDVQFHVLAWEGPPNWWASMDRVRERGIEVHKIRDMVPGLAEGASIPTIKHDPHPTREVYDAIARYVVEHLLP